VRRLGAGEEGRDGCGPTGGAHGIGAAARAAEARAAGTRRPGGARAQAGEEREGAWALGDAGK
jgi:hypothetical protein